MITRVLGPNNEILHDCDEIGCTVSWDGYARQALTVKQLHGDGDDVPADATGVKKGEQVPGATEIDTTMWKVAGKTAKLINTRG